MDNPVVTEEQLGNALRFLSESDIEFAQEKAELERAEIRRKRCRARSFLEADGNNEERKAKAEIDPKVGAADDEYIATVKAYETLKARRQRAEIVVDVWRTISANMRKTI